MCKARGARAIKSKSNRNCVINPRFWWTCCRVAPSVPIVPFVKIFTGGINCLPQIFEGHCKIFLPHWSPFSKIFRNLRKCLNFAQVCKISEDILYEYKYAYQRPNRLDTWSSLLGLFSVLMKKYTWLSYFYWKSIISQMIIDHHFLSKMSCSSFTLQ